MSYKSINDMFPVINSTRVTGHATHVYLAEVCEFGPEIRQTNLGGTRIHHTRMGQGAALSQKG